MAQSGTVTGQERATLDKLRKLRTLAEDPDVRRALDLDLAFVGKHQTYSFYDYLDSTEAMLRRLIAPEPSEL